jgi:hypothetical protein
MRPSRASITAAACAALVAALYFAPVARDVARHGLGWPIWIQHPEGLCDTTIGKWLFVAPHHAQVDGSSGEFPIYYQSLSDSLINLIAELGGWAPMTVQAVLYGPALGFAFLLANYASLAAVLHDRRAALWASLLISLGGNASFWNRPDDVAGMPLDYVLHVPFHALPLATAQSLGWVLFLPCLALTHVAYQRFSRRRALALGLVLGLLFYAHTLTFVNAAAAQLAYFVLVNALERPRRRGFGYWLVGLGGVAGAFAWVTLSRPVASFASVVALGGVALALTFAYDARKRFYLWVYVPAAAVALPYMLLLARHARTLAAAQAAWDQVQMLAVSLTGFVLFFCAYLCGGLVALLRYRDRSVLTWLTALVLSTGVLALNQFWHWSNHPYRFAIHMIFPLGILAALGLRRGPRRLAVPLGLWLLAVCGWDAYRYVAGPRDFVDFKAAEPERAAFLSSVRSLTAPDEGRNRRILNPAEIGYPRGVDQSAMLMSYSRIPGFVPDYRHVLWRKRYENRMGVFCFLFPGYPNSDHPFGRHACDEHLDPDPTLAEILDPRLRTGILPVYGITLAGAPAKPFANAVKDASARYGWPVLAQASNAALARTVVARLPGVAQVTEVASRGATLTIRLGVEQGGSQLLILGGRRLSDRAPEIVLGGRAIGGCRRADNWAVCTTDAPSGAVALELPSHESGADPEADYLYFLALLHRDEAGRYVRLPWLEDPSGELRARPSGKS